MSMRIYDYFIDEQDKGVAEHNEEHRQRERALIFFNQSFDLFFSHEAVLSEQPSIWRWIVCHIKFIVSWDLMTWLLLLLFLNQILKFIFVVNIGRLRQNMNEGNWKEYASTERIRYAQNFIISSTAVDFHWCQAW